MKTTLKDTRASTGVLEWLRRLFEWISALEGVKIFVSAVIFVIAYVVNLLGPWEPINRWFFGGLSVMLAFVGAFLLAAAIRDISYKISDTRAPRPLELPVWRWVLFLLAAALYGIVFNTTLQNLYYRSVRGYENIAIVSNRTVGGDVDAIKNKLQPILIQAGYNLNIEPVSEMPKTVEHYMRNRFVDTVFLFDSSGEIKKITARPQESGPTRSGLANANLIPLAADGADAATELTWQLFEHTVVESCAKQRYDQVVAIEYAIHDLYRQVLLDHIQEHPAYLLCVLKAHYHQQEQVLYETSDTLPLVKQAWETFGEGSADSIYVGLSYAETLIENGKVSPTGDKNSEVDPVLERIFLEISALPRDQQGELASEYWRLKGEQELSRLFMLAEHDRPQHIETAQAMFEQSLQNNPHNVRARYGMGRTQILAGLVNLDEQISKAAISASLKTLKPVLKRQTPPCIQRSTYYWMSLSYSLLGQNRSAQNSVDRAKTDLKECRSNIKIQTESQTSIRLEALADQGYYEAAFRMPEAASAAEGTYLFEVYDEGKKIYAADVEKDAAGRFHARIPAGALIESPSGWIPNWAEQMEMEKFYRVVILKKKDIELSHWFQLHLEYTPRMEVEYLQPGRPVERINAGEELILTVRLLNSLKMPVLFAQDAPVGWDNVQWRVDVARNGAAFTGKTEPFNPARGLTFEHTFTDPGAYDFSFALQYNPAGSRKKMEEWRTFLKKEDLRILVVEPTPVPTVTSTPTTMPTPTPTPTPDLREAYVAILTAGRYAPDDNLPLDQILPDTSPCPVVILADNRPDPNGKYAFAYQWEELSIRGYARPRLRLDVQKVYADDLGRLAVVTSDQAQGEPYFSNAKTEQAVSYLPNCQLIVLKDLHPSGNRYRFTINSSDQVHEVLAAYINTSSVTVWKLDWVDFATPTP